MTRWTWAALAALALAGCDGTPKTYKIPGKLVYQDGAPVPGATVVLQTTVDGKAVPARGMAKEDGTFVLSTFKEDDGVVAGDHQVSVIPLPPQDGPVPVEPAVPRQYGDFETSGLKATVTPETKELVITIGRPGRR